MSDPYTPKQQAREYHRMPIAQREAIRIEVDRRFREKTNITRRLDPTSRQDLELRRTWLRIRDEVMDNQDAKEDAELRHELDLDGLTAIPEEMRFNGWEQGARLLDTWFERQPAIAKNYSNPVTDVIKMDWVLGFPRAREAYDWIMSNRLWTSEESQKQMAKLLKSMPKPVAGQSLPWGDLSQPVAVVNDLSVNFRAVTNGLNYDGLSAALGAFVFNVAIAGRMFRPPLTSQVLVVTVAEVGIYVKDSFDFNGDQFLGFWGYRDTPYYNRDFREWRGENQAGGDFLVFSDIKRTRLATPDAVSVKE
jgi:hypothetical protein